MSDNKDELAKLRENINRIDSEMVRLLNERAGFAHKIGEAKQGSIYRPEREAQILRRLSGENPGPLAAQAIQHIFREIMSACLALEQPLKIAFLGPAGTYSESAARKHFGSSPSLDSCPDIDEVFRAVAAGVANYGVVPVENSTEGAIGRTLDLLLTSPLKICGEINLPIHHNLMTRCGSIDDVKRIYSHSQSLGQCQDWLNKHLPALERIPVVSNSEAARRAAEEESSAAIAGESAAALYGLHILHANVEDDPTNTTRFLVIASHDAGPSGNDKTSLVCSAQHKPGAVHELLTPLARHGVSMTRFESRPARGLGGSQWEYVFYIDLLGHRLDASVQRALEELHACAGYVKELGSYPLATA
ncbi:Chorismate mutase / Prephenate dehydratase [Georgfuchsia toluolica]|uniref:Bifunctional chorismate mutase/prephenate dehydratase n=1 Tax=Georgfuchsia toluolica TaxID=424218 RepID=A0A916J3D6_9PROT|nr:prephenate dehydratase [Georgfuchsia toluolica]CAG4883231.1 Chorismate mutase / Prephenate dehydratase [Georgfuchsia toluolica]